MKRPFKRASKEDLLGDLRRYRAGTKYDPKTMREIQREVRIRQKEGKIKMSAGGLQKKEREKRPTTYLSQINRIFR